MQVYWQESFSQGPNCEITYQPRFWAGFIVCRWHNLDNQHRMFPQTLSLGNLCRCNGCFPTWLGKGATFLTRRLSWGSLVPFFQADLDPQLLLFVVVYVFIVVCNGVRYKNGWNWNSRQFGIKGSFSQCCKITVVGSKGHVHSRVQQTCLLFFGCLWFHLRVVTFLFSSGVVISKIWMRFLLK